MLTITKLIQSNFNRAELLRRALKPKSKKIKPVITFSREAGSGGRLIAQLVCQKLGFDYYERNLIDLIAHQAKLEKEIISDLDEKKENSLSGVIRQLFGKEALPQQAYIRALSHTILAIAEKGSSVIMGRGANFIIPPTKRLSIRVISPLRVRIRNNIIFDKHTEAHARKSIKSIHFNRKDFVKKYFSKNISNANYYDMVVNTEYVSLAEAADLVIRLYAKRFLL